MTDPFSSTGSSLLRFLPGKITVYPNPAGGRVTIRSDRKIGMVVIRNLSGQEISRQYFPSEEIVDVNLERLSPGIYLLQAGDDVEKIVKY